MTLIEAISDLLYGKKKTVARVTDPITQVELGGFVASRQGLPARAWRPRELFAVSQVDISTPANEVSGNPQPTWPAIIRDIFQPVVSVLDGNNGVTTTIQNVVTGVTTSRGTFDDSTPPSQIAANLAAYERANAQPPKGSSPPPPPPPPPPPAPWVQPGNPGITSDVF